MLDVLFIVQLVASASAYVTSTLHRIVAIIFSMAVGYAWLVVMFNNDNPQVERMVLGSFWMAAVGLVYELAASLRLSWSHTVN